MSNVAKVAPGTVVFVFALRYDAEPESEASHCRFIASPGWKSPDGSQHYNRTVYEIQRMDLSGQPRWEDCDDKPPVVLMAELFRRVVAPHALGIPISREDGAVRTVDLGTIVVPRSAP